MDHAEAKRINAPSRYIVGDLTWSETVAFEGHFFTCSDCAEELRRESTLAEDLRAVFRDQGRPIAVVPSTSAVKIAARPNRFGVWTLPLAVAATILLGIIIYQNGFMIPQLKSEVARLSEPQTLAWVPLKLARGSEPVEISNQGQFWMAFFDLPNPTAHDSYLVDIQNKDSKLLRTVAMPAAKLGQHSSILLRRSEFPGGAYQFKVRARDSDAVIATYLVNLKPE